MQQTVLNPEILYPHNSKWTPPHEFPDLSDAKIICVDLETYDPELTDKGCGSRRGAYTAGIAVGTDTGFRGYFPMRHEGGGNMDIGVVKRWAQDTLGNTNQIKLGANILYDLEMLLTDDIKVAGPVYDVQYAEALIDEQRLSYSLNNIAKTYLGETKVTDALHQYEKSAFGTTGKNIAKCPAALVGPYAEGDVDLPLRIWGKQEQLLRADNIFDLFELECDNIGLMLAMRQRGVRVDVEKTIRVREQLLKQVNKFQRELDKIAGFPVNVDAAASLGKLFDKLGLAYPRTAKTKAPSFVKDWLINNTHLSPIIDHILMIRKYRTIIGTFLEGYILGMHINGRIYTQFHPLRSDEGGTVSGRYSSSLPNLQNIPSRDETPIPIDGKMVPLGKLIRSLFIPDEGCDWYKDDYSQVEFRILTHYGSGPSAEKARSMYQNDPKTDFHTMCAELCGIDRSPAKNINFGLAYNMGEVKLAESLNRSVDEARELFQQYHENLPFVKGLQTATSSAASKRGYIKTILNRRARFNLWESKDWDRSKYEQPLPYDKALKREEAAGGKGIRRAYVYKASNRLIQGSAADIMKAAMNKIWRSGVCDVIGVPHLTVHDELDWSIPHTKEAKEAHDEAIHLMQTAVKLKIPLICDSEKGPNWGEVK